MPALRLHFMNKIVDQMQRMHAWAAGNYRCCCPSKVSASEIDTCVCTFTLKAAPAAAAATNSNKLKLPLQPRPTIFSMRPPPPPTPASAPKSSASASARLRIQKKRGNTALQFLLYSAATATLSPTTCIIDSISRTTKPLRANAHTSAQRIGGGVH